MASRSQDCRVDPRTRETLAREFVGLHEGLPMRKVQCEPMAAPGPRRAIGQAIEVEYWKPVPGGRGARRAISPRYNHPSKTFAHPTIGVDREGHLHFKSGRMETRRRGIEDRVPRGKRGSAYIRQPHLQPEKWLTKPPKRLVTLGPLRFVKYIEDDGAGTKRPVGARRPVARRLSFDRAHAPDLAHDEHGNLYAVGGRYRIDAPLGESTTMARRRRRHSMHGLFGMSRRHRRRHNAYANPSRSSSRRGGYTLRNVAEHAGKTALAGLGVGVVSVLTAVGLDKAFSYVTMDGTWKAISKIATGLLAGAAVSFAPEGFEPVSMGLMAGGVTDGGLDLWNLYAVPWFASMSAPVPQPGANTTTPPAHGALGPGGIPANYAAYGPANCAVPSQRRAA